MSWMTPNMEMQTSGGGSLGKAFGRMLSGEAIFQNIYTAKGAGEIAFASSFPGAIRAMPISPERPVIVQKKAFLASERGVELSVFFQKKMGAGFFGGEGFIMQRLSGRGPCLYRNRRVGGRIHPRSRRKNGGGHRILSDDGCYLFD